MISEVSPSRLSPSAADRPVRSAGRLVRDISRRSGRLRFGRPLRAALRPAAAAPDAHALGPHLHDGAGGLVQPEQPAQRAELGVRPELLQLRAGRRAAAAAPPAGPLQPPPAQARALPVLTAAARARRAAGRCAELAAGAPRAHADGLQTDRVAATHSRAAVQLVITILIVIGRASRCGKRDADAPVCMCACLCGCLCARVRAGLCVCAVVFIHNAGCSPLSLVALTSYVLCRIALS